MKSSGTISRLESILLSVLFCIGISLPLCKQMIMGEPDTLSIEARPLNKFPAPPRKTASSVRKYTTGLENYYNDHFGFRSALLRLNTIVKAGCLRVSPAGNVDFGKNGWLFLKDWMTFRGTMDVRKQDLEQWRLTLERRDAWLAKRGIRYLYVMAPNKSTIYSDYLAKPLNEAHAAASIEQLNTYLSAHSQVPFLSLREALLDARTKSPDRLYYPSDTHWNTMGAYVGYRELMLRLQTWFPELQPSKRSDFRVSETMHNGDLARMIGIPEFAAGKEFELEPLSPAKTTETGFKLPDVEQSEWILPVSIANTDPTRKLTAVVLRDSFGTSLVPYLVPHFSKVISIWSTEVSQKFEADLADVVEREKPDVFIEERVERVLMGGPPPESMVFGGKD